MSLKCIVALHCLTELSSASGPCEGMTIQAEDNSVSCAAETRWPHSQSTPAPSESSNGAADMDACFRSYCSSSSARDTLVSSCKSKGYSDCDSLRYHDTYFRDANSGNIVYDFVGDVVYDNDAAEISGQRRGTRFTQTFQNGNDQQSDYTDFAHTVTKTSSYTWSSESSVSVTASVGTSVTVKIPEVAEVGVTAGYSTTLDLKQGSSATDTNGQSFQVTQRIYEEPQSCTRACIVETEGEATVPYTLSGKFSGNLDQYESWAGPDDGFVCCYLRSGGGNDCSVLGHGSGGPTGWALSAWPGYAVAHGNCPNFGYSGYSATYTTHGQFSASMDFEVDVKTAKGPYSSCPEASVCDVMAHADSSEPLVV